jgi:hypothetical protein
MEAESELEKLEARLGMRQQTTSAPASTVSVGVGGTPALDPAAEAVAKSEAERELEELERRLKGA